MVDLYPISITTMPLVRPAPQVVPVATIRGWPRRSGNSQAHRLDLAGITEADLGGPISSIIYGIMRGYWAP